MRGLQEKIKKQRKYKEKGKKKREQSLVCNLSTQIFDHSEGEGQEMPHISYTELLTLPLPPVARPFYCSVGLLNTYSAQWPSYF